MTSGVYLESSEFCEVEHSIQRDLKFLELQNFTDKTKGRSQESRVAWGLAQNSKEAHNSMRPRVPGWGTLRGLGYSGLDSSRKVNTDLY